MPEGGLSMAPVVTQSGDGATWSLVGENTVAPGGAMALRWAAASFVETQKSYRRIIGYDQLWMLRAHLDDHEPVAEMRKAG